MPRKQGGKRHRGREAAALEPDISDTTRHILSFTRLDDIGPCFLVSKNWRAEVLRMFPQLARLDALTTYQRATIKCIRANKVQNLVAAVDRRCVICEGSWRGGVNQAFGIPAHPACVKDKLLNVNYLPKHVSSSWVLKKLPSQKLSAYSSYYGAFTYDAVWDRAHPCIPYEWTLEGFEDQHYEDLLDARLEYEYEQEEVHKSKRKRRGGGSSRGYGWYAAWP